MATIYRRKDPKTNKLLTPYYYVAYTIDKATHRKSTKKKIRKEAEKVKRKIEREIEDGTFNKKAEVPHYTWQMFCDFIQTNYKDKLYLRMYEGKCERFLEHFGADTLLADLTTEDIEDYIDWRKRHKFLRDGGTVKTDDVKNGTVNSDLRVIKHCLKLLAEKGKIVLPKTLVIKFLDESDSVRTGFITYDEMKAVADAALPHIRPVIMFGYLTGWRLQSILDMRWGQVRLGRDEDGKEEGIVEQTSRSSATKGRAVAVLDEEMIDIMKKLYEKALDEDRGRDNDYVFVNTKKNKITGMNRMWHSACEKAGLVNTMTGKHYYFHDMRRSFVKDMTEAHVPPKVVMEMGGWSTISTYLRYNIVDRRQMKEAVDARRQYFKRNNKH